MKKQSPRHREGKARREPRVELEREDDGNDEQALMAAKTACTERSGCSKK